MSAYRFCRTDDVALLVDALNRCWSPYFPDEPLMTPADVQAVHPRPSGLVQQLHGRLLRVRPDRHPDWRQAAFRNPRLQDRRPSRSSATGSRPSPAHIPRFEARDSRAAAHHRRSPRDAGPCARAVQRKRICGGRAADGLRPARVPDAGRRSSAESRRSSSLSPSTISPPTDCSKRVIPAGSARLRPSRHGRTTSPDSPSPPTSESRPTCSTSPVERNRRQQPTSCRSAVSSTTTEPVSGSCCRDSVRRG